VPEGVFQKVGQRLLRAQAVYVELEARLRFDLERTAGPSLRVAVVSDSRCACNGGAAEAEHQGTRPGRADLHQSSVHGDLLGFSAFEPWDEWMKGE
jgi:hypothetical protein